MGYSYNADERETNINFSDANDEATIYTASGPMLTKLERLCREFPQVYKRTATETAENGRLIAGRYSIANKRLIRFGKPASVAQIEAAKKNAVKMCSTPRTAP